MPHQIDADELSSKIIGSKCRKCNWTVSNYQTESERRTLVLEHLRQHKNEYGFLERKVLGGLYKQFGLEF